MSDLRLRGRVRAAAEDAGAARTRVVVTSQGHVLSETQVAADGTFDVVVVAAEDVVVSLVGEDHRALRVRAATGEGDTVDLGELEIPVTEFPSGVSGKAWDREEDRPAVGGLATLRRQGEILGSDRIDSNGDFAIETRDHLLSDGTYQLVIAVPGYEPQEQVVEVKEGTTVYRVGRVELTASPHR